MAEPSTGHETIDEDLLAALAGFDTPMICNALEIAAPERPVKKMIGGKIGWLDEGFELAVTFSG